jgi:hypothetical protein
MQGIDICFMDAGTKMGTAIIPIFLRPYFIFLMGPLLILVIAKFQPVEYIITGGLNY